LAWFLQWGREAHAITFEAYASTRAQNPAWCLAEPAARNASHDLAAQFVSAIAPRGFTTENIFSPRLTAIDDRSCSDERVFVYRK
jgi:hypothetical protein